MLDSGGDRTYRTAVALMGKVYCKVDAGYSPIDVGDLLTTSPTPGHAMKAVDPARAFGAVIGKALRPMVAGQGLLPILIDACLKFDRRSHRQSLPDVPRSGSPGFRVC